MGETAVRSSGETTALRVAADEDREEEEGPAPPCEAADFPPDKAATGAAKDGGFEFAGGGCRFSLPTANARPPSSWEASADEEGASAGSDAAAEDDLVFRWRVIA